MVIHVGNETYGLISVIIPAYNAQEYIDECIESIIRQTYGNFEIIIVDDGSKDKTGEICDKWQKSDQRIKVYHIPNSGPAYARNFGKNKAQGDYVTFIDADDWIDRVTLGTCISEIGNSDILLFNLCDYNDSCCIEKRVLKSEKVVFDGQEIEYLVDILLTDRTEYGSGAISLTGAVCKLYRGNLLETCMFPESLLSGEDCCFILQGLKRARRVTYINKVLYHRRINKNSLSHNHNCLFLEQRLDYVNWILDFFKDEKEKRWKQLNEFCFVNYCNVVEHIADNSEIKLKDKLVKAKEFKRGIHFNWDFKEIVINEENKNRKRIKQYLARGKSALVFLFFEFYKRLRK